MGEFDAALRTGEEAIRLAEITRQPEALQWAYYPLGLLALDRGDLDTAVTMLERVLSICRDAEMPVYVPRTNAALSYVHVLLGRTDAIVQLEQSVVDAERRRQVNVHTSALVRLADAYLHVGQIDQATQAAERVVDLARERGERGTKARALRLLATAYHRATPPRLKDAEAPYRAALAITDELEMRPQAALCRLGLGMLLSATARKDEARELLRAAEVEARHSAHDVGGGGSRTNADRTGVVERHVRPPNYDPLAVPRSLVCWTLPAPSRRSTGFAVIAMLMSSFRLLSYGAEGRSARALRRSRSPLASPDDPSPHYCALASHNNTSTAPGCSLLNAATKSFTAFARLSAFV